MRTETSVVIATRSYFNAGNHDSSPLVHIEINSPTPSPHQSGEYQCSFIVRSPDSTRTETVYGIDPLQALLLALGYAEAELRRLSLTSSLQLRWMGGEDGDFGIRIPGFIP
jgi:hypothetical protein